MRRGLSAVKRRQNSAQASRAAVLDTVDVGMRANVAYAIVGRLKYFR